MKRINKYTQTEAMAIDVMAKGMTGKVYNLAAGDPNLDVCEALAETLKKTDIKATHNYGSSRGNLTLRKKIWDHPEEVIIANGAKQLMYMSMAAVSRPGDEMVLIGPCWTSYTQICSILGIEYRLFTGREEDRYIPDINMVRNAVTEKTAAIIVNNPNNPTGVVYSDDYINALLDMAVKNDCWLISDEIYKDIAEYPAISLRGRKNTVVIDGFSKSYNITGWRLGYAIGEKEVISSMVNLQSQMSGPPSTIIQQTVCDAWEDLVKCSYADYSQRIDILCEIDKFKEHRPNGGFYFYVPIDKKWKSSMELCEYMLNKFRIAMTPGDSYGVKDTVRISVANISRSDLEEIINYLKEV